MTAPPSSPAIYEARNADGSFFTIRCCVTGCQKDLEVWGFERDEIELVRQTEDRHIAEAHMGLWRDNYCIAFSWRSDRGVIVNGIRGPRSEEATA